MRVAVLGGGITGVSAALELAERGVNVDLYEQDAHLVSRASYWNEGKIHLGLVYAQDQSRRTARTMVESALRFRPLLARWIPTAMLDRAVSDPFLYAVHRLSLTSVEEVEAHFRCVAELYESVRRQPGTEYLAPIGGWIWRRSVNRAQFSDEDIVASYDTEERSVDPMMVAAGLRAAVTTAPHITVLTNRTVTRLETLDRSDFTVVSADDDQTYRDSYDVVINALWQNRLGIDASLGLTPPSSVLHRFKVGLHSKPSFVPGVLPSVTFMLGPFGDIVNFRDRTYLSWYPAGHLLTSMEPTPSVPDGGMLASDLSHVETATLEALGHLIPGCASQLRASAGQWDIGGGYITAWGKTGIHDPLSQLHDRFAIGVHSTGRYHSIDTGKYTAGPYLAETVCDRIVARRSVAATSQS